MSVNNVYVVGDRFKTFACNDHVFSLSDFMSQLAKDPSVFFGTIVKPAQGLSFSSMRMIEDAIKVRGLEQSVRYEPLSEKLFDRRYVHKHHDYNVLLSHPTKKTETLYTASLLIDERCADISDHMTGQHVQGMILTEAARQMFIGVTEAYIIPDDQLGNIVYIFNKMAVDFVNFVFPLPIDVHYKIINQKQGKGYSISFEVEVEFYQNDTLSALTKISFTTYEASHIHQIEQKKAKQSVVKALTRSLPSRSVERADTEALTS